MKIIHVLNGAAAEKESRDGEAGFFLSNGCGGFAHFATASGSKYQGVFVKLGNSLFKIVESVNVASGGVAAVENTGHSCIFHRGSFFESFFMPLGRNSLVHQLSIAMPVEIFLDVRRANDFRQWGRDYNASLKGGNFVVRFTKRTDSREDGGSGREEFAVYVAVKHDGALSRIGEWVKRFYSLDAGRNSAGERYVYKAATVNAGNIVVSAAESAAAAVKEADSVFKSIGILKAVSKRRYDSLCESESLAANAAAIALDKLVAKQGMYAGLPWFFQEWSRDELVSCAALPAAARKKIVLGYLGRIQADGRLPDIAGSDAASADSVGWLFKRASELLDENAFTAKEKEMLAAALKKSIGGILKCHFSGGFITNEKNETWMDTSFNDDGRKGACIEIQALQLSMYHLMRRLAKDSVYGKLEQSLLQNVRHFFWDGSILADRLNEFTARPNIFIAAYVYRQLLSNAEWEACISNALDRLWLGWGGLATIDKSHPCFRGEYTGETNESYHRGDSWFWVNNIAAIAMARINKKKFQPFIEKILAASANDILWNGAIGCGSELSSANEQRAEGCLNQAWSNATFIELIKNAGRPMKPGQLPVAAWQQAK